MGNKIVLNANHIRAQYRYIFYSECKSKGTWFDAPFTSLLSYDKARNHPIVYTFIIDNPIDKRYESVGTHFWDDPELYERSFKNNLIPFAGSNWKEGEKRV